MVISHQEAMAETRLLNLNADEQQSHEEVK